MKSGSLIKRLLALSILLALLFLVDLRGLVGLFSKLSFAMICYLMYISFVLVYVSAMKWGIFLRALGIRRNVLDLTGLYLVGYFVNLLLPSFVGGDVVRSMSLGKDVGKHEAVAATVLERFTGLVAMVGLGVIFVWFAPMVTTNIKVTVLIIAIGLGVMTAMAMSPKLLSLAEKIPKLGSTLSHFRKIQEAFKFGIRRRETFAQAMLLSMLYYFLAVVNTLACAYAVGWIDAPWKDLFVVLPIILLIGALPISPSGLGIQEGAFFFFLQGLGASPEQALGVGFLLRAKVYVLALCGWIIWILRPAKSSELEPTLGSATLDSAKIKPR